MHRRTFLTSGIISASALVVGQKANACVRHRRRCRCSRCCPSDGIKPIAYSREAGYYWDFQIDGYQSWRLVYPDGSPYIVASRQSFKVEIYPETNYFVTEGRGRVVGGRAWLGYGYHHPDNQAPTLFDGAFYIHAGCPRGTTSAGNPITFTESDVCYGQIYASVNDGYPDNNVGRLYFSIMLL